MNPPSPYHATFLSNAGVLVVSDTLWALPVLRPVTTNRAGGWQGPAEVRVLRDNITSSSSLSMESRI